MFFLDLIACAQNKGDIIFVFFTRAHPTHKQTKTPSTFVMAEFLNKYQISYHTASSYARTLVPTEILTPRAMGAQYLLHILAPSNPNCLVELPTFAVVTGAI
eukprot:GEMP01072840.1.p1 GENE.GEMP01072840.1~~GEMP01072840.1.p1  ORF type:complete len:102 (-),score=8.94 GEMP01072840.1:111-416(-)